MSAFFSAREVWPVRFSFLTGVSVLSFVAVAQAQGLPDNTSGTIAAPQTGPLLESTPNWDVTVTSAGAITGGIIGINNAATGGTLANGGEISGSSDGVFENMGATGAISNSGIISGGNDGGIVNGGGTITTLTNETGGTITGALDAGIFNSSGTIGNL